MTSISSLDMSFASFLVSFFFKILFFDVDHFQIFIEFVTILLPFSFLVLAIKHVESWLPGD